MPTVAIVDTNANPELIDYPIAGNDDAIRAIRIVLQKLVDAIVSAGGEGAKREEAELAGSFGIVFFAATSDSGLGGTRRHPVFSTPNLLIFLWQR